MNKIQKVAFVPIFPIRVCQSGPDRWIVHDVTIALQNKCPGLMYAHFCQNVRMVVATCFVANNVRHAQKRTGTQSTLDVPFNVIGQHLDLLSSDILIRKFIQSFLKIRNTQHGPESTDFERMRRLYFLLDDFKGDRIAIGIEGVLGTPRSIVNECIEKHALTFRQGRTEGWVFLTKQRARLLDAAEMGSMTSLMKKRSDCSMSTADCFWVSKRGKVCRGRLPSPVGFDPSHLRPVAKSIRVFVLALQQIKIHGRSFVFDVHFSIRSYISFWRF
mmetsp:Transcript_898/g.1529  ORF Transcript_898/g.1529 Transcript_898/m.1529 type:complete len:273 (+) Transcript_898:643-1461(+)